MNNFILLHGGSEEMKQLLFDTTSYKEELNENCLERWRKYQFKWKLSWKAKKIPVQEENWMKIVLKSNENTSSSVTEV